MKIAFTVKQKLCLLICVLTVLNALCFTELQKTRLETENVCALTDRYEADILEMEDSNRKTLVTRLLTMDAFVGTCREIFDQEAFPEGVSAMLAYDGDNMGKKAEQYGSNAVNSLMLAFADVTKQHFPESNRNIVCNVGEKSDEFYVLLLGRPSKEALIQEIEAFQQDIREIRIPTESGEEMSGSVSIGIAFYHQGDSFDALFEEADAAGYAAKEAGKDCYYVAEDREAA